MLMFMRGFSTAGDQSIISEMAPDASGLAFGISNTFSSAMGFLAPLIAGLIIDANVNINMNCQNLFKLHFIAKYNKINNISLQAGSPHPWNMVWITSGVASIIGGIIFQLFATAEIQPWGSADYEPGKTNQKRVVHRQTSVIPSSEIYHVQSEALTTKTKKKKEPKEAKRL